MSPQIKCETDNEFGNASLLATLTRPVELILQSEDDLPNNRDFTPLEDQNIS